MKKGSSFQRRLSAYSTLAAAGACATAALPSDADATVVYSGPLSLAVTVSVTGSYFNLSTFAFGASYSAVNGGDTTAPVINLWGTGSTFAYLYPSSSVIDRFVSSGSSTSELAAGATIDALSTYGTSRAPGALSPSGLWTAGSTGYLGIRFLNGATTEYGWVQIFCPGTPTTGSPIRILGAAFEDSGLGITAGAVPEPGTISLLAFGCVSATVLAWRRRKAA